MESKLYVVNRKGEHEDVSFDEIIKHLRQLCDIEPKLNEIDCALLAKQAITKMIPGIKTCEIDNVLAEESACMILKSDEYPILASRISIHNLHKEVVSYYGLEYETDEVVYGPTKNSTYKKSVEVLYNNVYDHHGIKRHVPLISKEIFDFMMSENEEEKKKIQQIEDAIDHGNDYKMYDYFGITTMIRKYLSKNVLTNQIVDLPQYMLMTISIGIHLNEDIKHWDINEIIGIYKLMSMGYFTHATPTILNAGRISNQLASCYLIAMGGDTLEDISQSQRDCNMISQGGGGIGINVTNLRSRNSIIKTFNGLSHGVGFELLSTYNSCVNYVDQGGGKRKGAIAIYIEPWHADIEEFIDVKSNSGNMETKCNLLHYGIWMNDLFMERVLMNLEWSLFDPIAVPGLIDAYDEEFRSLYERYERENKAVKKVKATDLWYKILDKIQEVSEPYILFKDAINRKSNQKNVGTIRGSNLCTEICEYTSTDEIAVCTLMSFALPKYVLRANDIVKIQEFCELHENEDVDETCSYIVNGKKHYFDFFKLGNHVRIGVKNLNKIIDTMWYPDVKTERSNKRHRPIGIGVQGLADVFSMMEIPWESDIAEKLNKKIFKTIYQSALYESAALAQQFGVYSTFKNSPASKGIFQPELWAIEARELKKAYSKIYGSRSVCVFVDEENKDDCDDIDETIKNYVNKNGLRNSLLIAPMPTSTTAQILGNNEGIEPFSSNIYLRNTDSGEFMIYNKHLVRSLKDRNLWDQQMKNDLFIANGSVQNIPRIPDYLKKVFKTAWEIKQSQIIKMARDRAKYIDQNMSLTLSVETPMRSVLNALYFKGWRYKIKGFYYIRRKPLSSATEFNSISLLGGKRKEHDEKGKEQKDDSDIEHKKMKIQNACPLNSNVGLTNSSCDACSS